MRYVVHSHKNAEVIINGQPEVKRLFDGFAGIISGLTDSEIIEHFKANHEGRVKSLSLSINALLDQKLIAAGWMPQANIFAESAYGHDRRWRLDFSKKIDIEDNSFPDYTVSRESGIAVEVAFNHGEAIAWNLVKPTLAAEQNHVKKAIQADIGIIVTATDRLKAAGAFDSAVGSYEKFLTYMRPMSNILTAPLLIIGLDAPETFRVRQVARGNKKIGLIEMLN